MEKKSATDILKTAILLERRGKAFYSNIARQTQSEAVRKIFTMMAEEVREYMAQLGFNRLDDLIGRSDLLDLSSYYELERKYSL